MTVLVLDDTPVGALTLEAQGPALTALRFGRYPDRGSTQESASAQQENTEQDNTDQESSVLARTAEQLAEYFAGTRTVFDLPMAPSGTPFQLEVWARLREIPYGQTISYGELARRVGNAKASRAVGLANGRNPISIVVPCHRVIGADGTLTGFGGGMTAKQTLLDLERGALF